MEFIEIRRAEGDMFATRDGRIFKELHPVTGEYERVAAGGKLYGVHRLVAEAFCEKTNGKTTVNHIDGNKRNNNADNLEWCTPRENVQHAYKTGLVKKKKYRQFPYVLKKLMKERGVTKYKIAKDFGISQSTVANWLTGTTPHVILQSRLAEYFGCSQTFLMGEEQIKPCESCGMEGKDATFEKERA